MWYCIHLLGLFIKYLPLQNTEAKDRTENFKLFDFGSNLFLFVCGFEIMGN